MHITALNTQCDCLELVDWVTSSYIEARHQEFSRNLYSLIVSNQKLMEQWSGDICDTITVIDSLSRLLSNINKLEKDEFLLALCYLNDGGLGWGEPRYLSTLQINETSAVLRVLTDNGTVVFVTFVEHDGRWLLYGITKN